MSRIGILLRFVWDFVIGDDWQVAAGVAAALAVTALVADAGGAAWWILPVAVGALLSVSVLRFARDPS